MRVTVLGVPDSAGAYCVGVEQAPSALRDAGLLEALESAGLEVTDAGDLTMRRWAPDPQSRYAQNVHVEIEATAELARAAAPLLTTGERLLVLGGSCIVALGLCAAMSSAGQRPRLVYIDRHLDLNTPRSTTQGSLSWMGMAHALALEGSASALVESLGRDPLLDPSDLVYLGVETSGPTTDWERQQVSDHGLTVVDQASLCADPSAAARRAHDALDPGPFLVHLDVDVLDFLDAPIAEDVNGRNSGPTIVQLEQALAELLRDPHCLGLSIGQLDPTHAISDPSAIPRLVSALSGALRVT